jgi:hypothetical protein
VVRKKNRILLSFYVLISLTQQQESKNITHTSASYDMISLQMPEFVKEQTSASQVPVAQTKLPTSLVPQYSDSDEEEPQSPAT